jgi:hypothetical protein
MLPHAPGVQVQGEWTDSCLFLEEDCDTQPAKLLDQIIPHIPGPYFLLLTLNEAF